MDLGPGLGSLASPLRTPPSPAGISHALKRTLARRGYCTEESEIVSTHSLTTLTHAPSFCILIVSPLTPYISFHPFVLPGSAFSLDLFRPVCACLIRF
jgi:hypothetical protein